MIRSRWEMALFTDYVVGVFRLLMPSKKICILWDYFAWTATVAKTDPTWKQRYERITSALGDYFIPSLHPPVRIKGRK